MAKLRNGLEHRWGDRVCLNMQVVVSTAALARSHGCLKNLSLSGALVKADQELRLHAIVEVHILLPTPQARIAVVKAHVARKVTEGAGIEWFEFAPQTIKDLLRDPAVCFPARRMADP